MNVASGNDSVTPALKVGRVSGVRRPWSVTAALLHVAEDRPG
jgi:hypothetical protein